MAVDPTQIDFSKLAKYRFLPFVREGIAGVLTTVDTLGKVGSPAMAVRARFSASVTVRDLDGTATSAPITSPAFSVLGPGDVIGLDHAHLVRTDPHPGVTDGEYGYFPLVEFSRPDFPWMFTPAAADPQGRLRPWLCLVVVRAQEGVGVNADPNRPLPVLTISSPAVPGHELPDLRDSWLWAHAQILGHAFTAGQSEADRLAQVNTDLAADSHLNLSRLICPRNLQADTTYIACLVPAFAVGRKAGLGEDLTAADQVSLEPAWTQDATEVRLPVYQSFTFATGGTADFETLARQLVPRVVSPDFGTRPMDVSQAGSGLPSIPPADPQAVMPMEGALVAPGFVSAGWPQTPGARALASQLASELNAPARLQAQTSTAPGAAELTVAPPIYGRWHAAVSAITAPPAPPAPAWISQLNLDPRRRVGAGLGTSVVTAEEEDLMASAWAQIGEVMAANRALRLSRLMRAALGVVHRRHLAGARADDLLSMSAVAHRRLLAKPDLTIHAEVARSTITQAGASVTMRRMARPLGPMLARAVGSNAVAHSAPVQKMAAGHLRPAGPFGAPDGTSGLAQPSKVLDPNEAARVAGIVHPGIPAGQSPVQALDRLVTGLNAVAPASQPAEAQMIRNAPAAPDFNLVHSLGELSAGRISRVASVVASATTVTAVAAAAPRPGVSAARIPAHIVNRALDQLTAREAFDPAARGRLTGHGVQPAVADSPDAAQFRTAAAAAADRFIVMSDGVQIPARPVLQLEQARTALLQGLHPETTVVNRLKAQIGGLQLQQRDVPDPLQDIMAAPTFPRPMYEALRDYSQEFLVPNLDGVPPDTITLVQTNPTFVEAFLVGLNHEMARKLLWREYPTDQRGTYFNRFWPSVQPDIPAIPAFSPTALGTHTIGSATPRLVLLVRGKLLRRFPGAFVYATRDDGHPENPQLLDTALILPVFRGLLNPDVTIVGFSFTLAEALATPPGHGDLWIVIAQQPTEPRFGLDEGDPLGPDDISWKQLLVDPVAAVRLTHAPADAPGLAGRVIAGQRWGDNSAAQAHMTFKEPFRVALKARDVLPRP